ncbi:hypothetical protein DAEQUDRAFT_759843 [Daedalea quercina L-15889]|uniref:Uncharacterized protein n=1 Tax=Daedalea quercina L-15889 TaxID=1314783 RepID=A0A165LM15_9APHY|nr:hypothetical protein DAEQUDRAFT_759843 [Daedalea quercina L-15889]
MPLCLCLCCSQHISSTSPLARILPSGPLSAFSQMGSLKLLQPLAIELYNRIIVKHPDCPYLLGTNVWSAPGVVRVSMFRQKRLGDFVVYRTPRDGDHIFGGYLPDDTGLWGDTDWSSSCTRRVRRRASRPGMQARSARWSTSGSVVTLKSSPVVGGAWCGPRRRDVRWVVGVDMSLRAQAYQAVRDKVLLGINGTTNMAHTAQDVLEVLQLEAVFLTKQFLRDHQVVWTFAEQLCAKIKPPLQFEWVFAGGCEDIGKC